MRSCANKALHWTVIPLRCMAAAELCRSASLRSNVVHLEVEKKMKKEYIAVVMSLSVVGATHAADCESYNLSAKSNSLTIDERYESARLYRTCLVKSMATTPQEMLAAKSAAPVEDAQEQEEELAGIRKFMGMNFGVGFAISFYDEDIVSDASIVNGAVVANKTKDMEARVLLEFHNLIACNEQRRGSDFGCGPFAALATKENDLLGGVGVGWLWSWRNTAKTDGSGFSIGLGIIVDNDVKTLADGFRVGSAPPNGETAVRYVSEPRSSGLLFISNSF